jgi:hypothetical protein
VTFDESLKKTLEVKCVNLGMPDKFLNGTGLTKSPLLEIGHTKGGVDK